MKPNELHEAVAGALDTLLSQRDMAITEAAFRATVKYYSERGRLRLPGHLGQLKVVERDEHGRVIAISDEQTWIEDPEITTEAAEDEP